MGEYVREEIKRRGLVISHIARNLGISRQSMDWRFSKDEWSMSEVAALQKAVGDDSFFDRYFENSDQPRPFSNVKEVSVAAEEKSVYETKAKKSGYRISIEVDPDDFNPQEFDRMSEALKEMMAKLKK